MSDSPSEESPLWDDTELRRLAEAMAEATYAEMGLIRIGNLIARVGNHMRRNRDELWYDPEMVAAQRILNESREQAGSEARRTTEEFRRYVERTYLFPKTAKVEELVEVVVTYGGEESRRYVLGVILASASEL